jgi:hypothetical protein
MNPPNLFSFATSELSQDAVFAYILSWADKAYSDSPEYRELHGLGKDLLKAFVKSAAGAVGEADLLEDRDSLEVKVRTQVANVDVLVRVDGDIALIIEDKTGTGEHGRQMKRYVKALKEKELGTEQPTQILAVYVKTGNESIAKRKKSIDCGIVMRGDLLKVLDEAPTTNNTIVEDFHRHLQAIDSNTGSFRTAGEASWTWRAIEGFFLHLDFEGKVDKSDWCYISNPSGGFLGYWGHVRPSKRLGHNIYIQMHHWRQESKKPDTGNGGGPDDARHHCRLTIRVGRDKAGKVTHANQVEVLKACKGAVRDLEVIVTKAGRFRGGDSAAVADLTFAEGKAGYLATQADGRIDLPETEARLSRAMQLIEEVVQLLDEA